MQVQQVVKRRFKLHRHIVSSREPVKLVMPFAPGQLSTLPTFHAHQGDARLVVQAEVIAVWPDSSIRVVHLHCVPAASDADITVSISEKADAAPRAICQVESVDGKLEVSTGLRTQTLQLELNGCLWPFGVTKQLLDGHLLQRWSCEFRHPALPLDGVLYVTVYPSCGLIQVQFSVTNSQRAQHPGGLWDLGDKGSVTIDGLVLQLPATSTVADIVTVEPGRTLQAQRWSLSQLNSGGKAWQSVNHLDAQERLLQGVQGYQFELGEGVEQGQRATPLVIRQTDNLPIALLPVEFWQNFPCRLQGDDKGIELQWFARGTPVELQGGERKTWNCWLDVAADSENQHFLWQPTTVQAELADLQAGVFAPWLGTSPYDQLAPLIKGLDAQCGFAAKREIIDEYGWRNFGDLFADHESLYVDQDKPPFVSHYNNQYDPIYGFAKQFLLTGDGRWFQLMDQLARHVADIDIYHTDEDRAEYNHGLFWHTDHYLPAHTSTHRTYTKHNSTSSIPGQTGGGPANEHCYSTGLLYHYMLTGSIQSKQAVIELAQWMINLHESTPGLLSRLWSIKTLELPKLKAALKKQAVLPYRYPFTRGTGNYLNTLMDAWELTADPRYLNHVERVIAETIHPLDDIAKRELLDVENRWSYLVLLGTLPRYIRLKSALNQKDQAQQYAIACFYSYTKWLVDQEQMFLENPAALEFPNDTWTAQDLRKAMLMFQAAQMFPFEFELFHGKATQWLSWICHRLATSNELEFARIQALLMLNHGPHIFDEGAVIGIEGVPQVLSKAPALSVFRIIARMVKKACQGVIEFRPSREKHWLQSRITRS
jgi:hypothetical protein